MNKKFMAIFSSVMAAVLIVSASFAWFTSKDERVNHFETKQITDGSVNLLEIFDPPTDWKPGQEVIKNVSVVNNSEIDVLVRISFEEILKKLTSEGEMTQSNTADVSVAHPDWIPVRVTTSGYSSWTELTDSDTVDSIPSGLIVKYISGTNPANGNTVKTYFVCQDLGNNNYQKVTADFKMENDKVKIENISYYFFDGKTTTYADWAGENEKVPLLTPVIHPAANSITYPAKTGSLQTDNLIIAKYGALMQAMTDNNWWYNEADGYFYYIGKLTPGEISPLLLDTVTLHHTAGNEHALMELDLAVLLQAIQNTKAAIVASDGWALTDTTLINKLAEFCI